MSGRHPAREGQSRSRRGTQNPSSTGRQHRGTSPALPQHNLTPGRYASHLFLTGGQHPWMSLMSCASRGLVGSLPCRLLPRPCSLAGVSLDPPAPSDMGSTGQSGHLLGEALLTAAHPCWLRRPRYADTWGEVMKEPLSRGSAPRRLEDPYRLWTQLLGGAAHGRGSPHQHPEPPTLGHSSQERALAH